MTITHVASFKSLKGATNYVLRESNWYADMAESMNEGTVTLEVRPMAAGCFKVVAIHS